MRMFGVTVRIPRSLLLAILTLLTACGLVLSGCSWSAAPMNWEASQTNYEALRASDLRLAAAAVAGVTAAPMTQDDYNARVRLFDAWALDLKAAGHPEPDASEVPAPPAK